jgi:hypothetical protein
MTSSENQDLYQFIYVSRITSSGLAGASTLNDIAETSIKNNLLDAISGILCYGNGYFFQCVEGTEESLTNLKNRVLIDNRHKQVQTLDFSRITERRFTGWSLRSIILERWMINDPKVKSLMPFKPYNWNFKDWNGFLNVLESYYAHQEEMGDMDSQPIKYNALGLTISRVVGEHQAFILIQSMLGLLMLLALSWFMIFDKF